MTTLSRRRLLAGLLAAAGAAACGPIVEIERRGTEPTEGATVGLDSSSPPPTAAPTPSEPPPKPELYDPGAGEVLADVKRRAGRFAQQLATYEPGADVRDLVGDAARQRSESFDLAFAAGIAADLVVKGAQSAGEVVYAQLGGLDPHHDPRAAAVMVVLRQELQRDDGDQRTVTRTVDVRLKRESGEWRIDGLASVGGRPVRRPKDLPEAASAVVDDDRIDLPDTARWDIYRGDIDERLLVTMSELAGVFPYRVTVLRSGHPDTVFGTDLVSNHTNGRAVDIWGVGDTAVVRQNSGIVGYGEEVPGRDRRRPAFRAAETLYDRFDIPELGSPWDFDPPSQRAFTDVVHQDHLHVAVGSA